MLRCGLSGTVWAALALAVFIAAGWCAGQETAETGAKADAGASPPSAVVENPFTMRGTTLGIIGNGDNPIENGAILLAAYAYAKTFASNGAPLSATNRFVIFVPPGDYDLGSAQLEMDTEFLDLIGLSTARDDQYIHGTTNGFFTGVLRQTADNVRIENLRIESNNKNGGFDWTGNNPAAYFPDSGMPHTIIRNCEFRGDGMRTYAMRICIEYGGIYENCVGGASSFGGYGGSASGKFVNCTGGDLSFGGYHGAASGTFNNCTGGKKSFGAEGSAPGGRFYYCIGGEGSFTTKGEPTVLYCVRDGAPYPPAGRICTFFGCNPK